MPNLDSVTFDTAGFQTSYIEERKHAWLNKAGDVINISFVPLPPDIDANLDRPDEVRASYRSKYANTAGIIELDVLQIDICKSVRLIVKLPHSSGGMAYIGSLTIPFRDFSFVITTQSLERGIAGMRDAVILDALLASGQVNLASAESGAMGRITSWLNRLRGKPVVLYSIPGWMQDPYDPTVQTHIMRNLSEDEKYDPQFPDHPLSRVRAMLRQILPSIRLNAELENVPAFTYP